MIMRPEPKGWCPGAHRPMQSGDGMIVRVRPRLSQISAAQAKGLARLARQYGNGQIDLTNRANLQLRGLLPDAVAPVVEDLSALGLLDFDFDFGFVLDLDRRWSAKLASPLSHGWWVS